MNGITIEEAIFSNKIDKERFADFRCPICFKQIEIDEKDCEEYIACNGELYHMDCVLDEMKRLAKEFIIDCAYDEFGEYVSDWGLEHYCHTPEMDDRLFADETAPAQFMEEVVDVEEFLIWYEDYEKTEQEGKKNN